jgi:hypothetical protein
MRRLLLIKYFVSYLWYSKKYNMEKRSKWLEARIATVRWINFINKYKNKYESVITLNISNIVLIAIYYN